MVVREGEEQKAKHGDVGHPPASRLLWSTTIPAVQNLLFGARRASPFRQLDPRNMAD